MYNKIRFDTFMLMCFFMITILGLSACDSDEKITQEPPSQTYVKKAKEILAGDIVLSTRATMNGVDKTLLKSGCPTKFNFSWREDGMMILNLSDFSVGAMPFAISFKSCSSTVGNRMNIPEMDGLSLLVQMVMLRLPVMMPKIIKKGAERE